MMISLFKRAKVFMFLNKKVNLSNSEKIENSKVRIDVALNTFSSVRDELVEVNDELSKVVLESKDKVEKINSDIETATSEIQANSALIERVEQFLK